MVLSDRWWFWAAMAAVTAAVVAAEPRWRGAVARVRASALRRGLVEERGGGAIDTLPGGRWSEPGLPGLLLGMWVCGSPWIWGYDDVDGAIAADVASGGAIALVSLAGIVFPALLALNLLAGLWLITAPWLVGFGSDGGPVGLSDTVAGVAVCGLALRGLTTATSRRRTAQPGPVGRVPRREPPGP